MDIFLAGPMNGIEAAEKIGPMYDIPIIFLTAFADAQIVERAKATAPYGYILKPYDERELRTSIEIAIYKHALNKKLKESEARYRGFFTTSHDCVFIISPAGSWIDFNDAALEMFGYASREELLNVPLQSLCEHPEERAVLVKRVVEGGDVKEYPVPSGKKMARSSTRSSLRQLSAKMTGLSRLLWAPSGTSPNGKQQKKHSFVPGKNSTS